MAVDGIWRGLPSVLSLRNGAPSPRVVQANRRARRAVDRERAAARAALEVDARANGWGDWLDARAARVDLRTGEVLSEPPVIPHSVLACLADSWSFVMLDGAAAVQQVFRCGSWRCPRCGPWTSRVLCARLWETFIGADPESPPVPPGELVFVTVTERREAHRSGWHAARSAGDRFRELIKRVREDAARECGMTVDEAKRVPCRVVQVWEQHRKADRDGRGQFLHVHALVWCREIAERCRALGTTTWARGTDQEREAYVYGSRWWRLARRGRSGRARDLGFGLVDVQPVGDAAGVAKYLSKLAWMTAELGGSRAKAQTPTTAPARFRRIRATPGMLARLRRRDRVRCQACGHAHPITRHAEHECPRGRVLHGPPAPAPWDSAAVAPGGRAAVGEALQFAADAGRRASAAAVRELVRALLADGPEGLRAELLDLDPLPVDETAPALSGGPP